LADFRELDSVYHHNRVTSVIQSYSYTCTFNMYVEPVQRALRTHGIETCN